jgi:ATP-dependent Lhr-like helicase
VARRLAPSPADEGGRWPGRWSLVRRIGIWGRELPFEERIARQARQLLQAYGMVTRQSLEGDPEGGWAWGALYPQFRLMEMRGEVRRGYFVEGLPGVQFALPEAVERLRQWTRSPDEEGEEEPLVLVNATDPANLSGPALSARPVFEEDASPAEGEGLDAPAGSEAGHDPARFTRIPPNYVVLLRGRPVLLLETAAGRLTSLASLPPATLMRALRHAAGHLAGAGGAQPTFSLWNNQPIVDSSAAPLLEQAGFRREALDYVWDRVTMP